ncbi:MAG: Flagellar regulatory protein FleQ [Labilithrix sp.]|nr:Flagellar regulatory protein FleQ [Labilithrix sp.]
MAGDERTREVSRPALDKVHRLSIAVARGRDAGKLVEPAAGHVASVGTAADNDVVLTDDAVSRYHLELAPTADGIAVRDLGSTNGTFAGAVRVRDAVVPRGSQLRVGGTVLMLDAADAPRPEASGARELELPGMVFASEAMREVARRVRMLAAVGTSVLVHGETGAGKELVARALHELGPRAVQAFVVVDCASLAPSLLEAELFGHEKGAFTGAVRERAGAFERADGGTVFLDEVGELPPLAQASLLGVLERRRFRRVGGDREIAVDVRVVSATNRDLRSEVNRGSFRADLYFRLAGARVVVPPLRERPDDVAVLVRHFAQEMTGSDALPISDETLTALAAQHWAGNVRELRSAVERAVAFGAVELGAMLDDATETPRTTSAPAGTTTDAPIERYRDAKANAVAAFERTYLASVIERCGGNASEAARRAQMDRPYLLALLRRYGLR